MCLSSFFKPTQYTHLICAVGIALAFASIAQAESPLDQNIGEWLHGNRDAAKVLSILAYVDPSVSPSTPVRMIVSEQFYRKWEPIDHYQNVVSNEPTLREALAEVGLTLNMTPSEIAMAESDPQNPVFGHLGLALSPAVIYQNNRMFLILDFLKLYNHQIALPPNRQFEYLTGLGRRTMVKAHEKVNEYLSKNQTSRINLNALNLSVATREELARAQLKGTVSKFHLTLANLSMESSVEIWLAVKMNEMPKDSEIYNSCERILVGLRNSQR